MIEIKQGNTAKWRVNEYTFSDPQMGVRTINLTVNHPFDWIDGDPVEVADFKDSYVEYDGEQFYITNSKPTAEKDTSSLSYKYTLSFEAGESDFKRRKIRNLAEAGVDNFISQGTSFSLYADITQFVQLLTNNLKYYFGDKWNIVLSVPASDSVMLTINNMFIWDLLVKTYEYYGVRWFVRGSTLYIGGDPELIDHVFNYGVDGGLVKITRTAQQEQAINRLIGMGGSRNVPTNYFTDRYSKFPPDPNPISGDVNIKNIMPKVFRDSVKAGTLPYIDYVEDSSLVASDGVKEDALEPNDDIFPSIAGVEVPGLGRIDQIIAVETVTTDDPDQTGYKQTFDIWVKDIQFDLSDDQYTSTVDAKISFTSGYLTGYEFVILAENGQRKVVVDTSKSHNGVSSKYKITLIKSSEEFEASGRMLPNSVLNAVAGDSFVIYDINLPQSYVELAEERVQTWLESKLDELKQEKPTYTIEPLDQFFEDDDPEEDGKTIREKLKSGNKLKINNAKITDGVQELYINQVTIQYGEVLPKYTFVVTDKVNVQGGAVQRLQSSIDSIANRQYFTERELNDMLNGVSKKFLSKINPDVARGFIQFLSGLSVGDFINSMFAGKGAGIDSLGNAQVESLEVRSYFRAMEYIVNRMEAMEGDTALTEGDTIERVEDLGNGVYGLYLRSKWDGYFTAQVPNNVVKGIFNTLSTGSGEYYTSWFRVNSVNAPLNYIEVSIYDDEDVPAGKNFPPVEMMKFTRWGNQTDKQRQSCLFLSSTEGRIILLNDVTKPIIDKGNYGATFGKLPQFLKDMGLPISDDEDGVYIKTLITQNIIRFDHLGNPIAEIVDRGEFVDGEDYFNNDTNPETGVFETSDVWHVGCKWRCMSNLTKTAPRWNNTDWAMIEGNPEFTVEFMEKEELFDLDNFHPTLTIIAKLYNTDVTNDILTTDIIWTRYSEDQNGMPRVASDNAWAIKHANTGIFLELSLDDLDLDGYLPKTVIFTATVTIRDGEYELTNSASFGYEN